MGAYDNLFASAAKQNGIDPNLLRAVAQTESSGNPNAVSHDANGNPVASGLMQFTPATAKAMGVTDPTDPNQAIPAAARLLRQNLDASGGDQKQALMMYHGGTDQNNWGPKTQAYPNMVANNHAKIVQQQATNDPVYQFFSGGKSPAPATPAATAASTGSAPQADPVYDFFSSGGKSVPQGLAPQAPPADKPLLDQAWDALKGTASDIGSLEKGMAGGVAHLATGLGSGIAGGLTGIATLGKGLLTGQGIDKSASDATNAVNNITNKYTYRGQQGTAQGAGTDVMDSKWNPLNYIPNAANAAGDFVYSHTPDAIAPYAGAATTAAINLFAPLKAAKVAGKVSAALRAAPAAEIAVDHIPQQPTSSATPVASPEIQQAIQAAGDKAHPIAVQRHSEASSLPVPVDLTSGQATGNVNTMSTEQNLRGKMPELAQRFNAQNGQLIENINAIREAAAPDVTAVNHVENGQTLIDSYKNKDAALSADISAKYKALEDANGGQFPVDGKAFVDAANKALAQKMKGRYVPPEVQADMDQVSQGGNMTYADFENLRTNLAAEARKAERTVDGNRAMATSIVRQSLEDLPMTGDAANIKPLADAARNAARQRFALLESDPAYKAAVNDAVAPDDFINKFVVNGKVDNVKAMKANLSDDPLANQTISAGAINYLKTRAGLNGDTGSFSQAGYNKALQAVFPKLEHLFDPEQAQHLQTLGNVARYTQEQPRGSYVNNSNTLVGSAAQGAKELALGAANVKTLGLTGFIRKGMQNSITEKYVQDALQPGAGIAP